MCAGQLQDSSAGLECSRTKLFAAHPCRYGPVLRERDPQAFEQMRLVVGYYDLPQVRGGRDSRG